MENKRQSIQYVLTRQACRNIGFTSTGREYKTHIKRFAAWCRQNGARDIVRTNHTDAVKTVQRYTDFLQESGKSASTIHTYIAPVCKGLQIGMDEINKPRRTADTIKRSRLGVNKQGDTEETDARFARVVEFQKAVGLRRAELSILKGSDLVTDESGYLCIKVEKGKGGKRQLQRILQGHEEQVRAVFSSIGPSEAVFSHAEMSNHIDLHAMRAEASREAYGAYIEQLKNPGSRDRLIRELIKRYRTAHIGNLNSERGKGQYEKFQAILENKEPYRLRGHNRERAIQEGRPTEYDRLALMAVSVFHLSHWRLNVTVTNYML